MRGDLVSCESMCWAWRAARGGPRRARVRPKTQAVHRCRPSPHKGSSGGGGEVFRMTGRGCAGWAGRGLWGVGLSCSSPPVSCLSASFPRIAGGSHVRPWLGSGAHAWPAPVPPSSGARGGAGDGLLGSVLIFGHRRPDCSPALGQRNHNARSRRRLCGIARGGAVFCFYCSGHEAILVEAILRTSARSLIEAIDCGV